MASPISIDVHVSAEHIAEQLRADVRAGLTSTPKELPAKWFYDDRGSDLFDQITRLPEYYPTRRERAILVAQADAIATLSGADTLVELGSGTSEKTRMLLNAFAKTGQLRSFVPFDISEGILRTSAEQIAHDYGIDVTAIVGDFDHHLHHIPTTGRRMIAFLGGTIGNYAPEQRAVLLANLSDAMQPGDSLLLGTDLMKPLPRLLAAYDDAAGVTAEFNKNVLAVINRELGATFDLNAFEHVAIFELEEEWIEMRLRSTREQIVRIPALDLIVSFDEGEQMRTEISAKFREPTVRKEVEAAGLRMEHWWTDDAGDFALSLSVKD